MTKITINEVWKKHLRVACFLLVSGLLGFGLAYITDKPELGIIFAPVINYLLFAIKNETEGTGFVKAIK
ncbi:hypothetical protein M0R04_10310 [Candidatus Dojkabacteria bacterium]|jgi:hypothetical protein|nr:hypothetical protein [Candidatus Dojkabacteria bacterium]